VLCVMSFGEMMSRGNVDVGVFVCACAWMVLWVYVSVYCIAMSNNIFL
jgi:hypothetical protein